MSRAPVYAFMAAAALAVCAPPVRSQAVICTRSGLVHYFDGAVTVDGQPLQSQLGKFTSIPEGGELRTAQGRAEVLLTPGVFLRVGDNSAIRMVATALSDTRVELLAGSAIVDSLQAGAAPSVTLIYAGWNIRQPEKGIYRIDSDPPRLRVSQGKAEAKPASGAAIPVAQAMDLPLTDGATPETAAAEPHDTLSDWANGRSEAITADNDIAAGIQDPGTMSNPLNLPEDGFTYYPMLPFPSVASYDPLTSDPLVSYPYGVGAVPASALGFYSIYLPGYTRPPLGLGLGLPIGLRTIYGTHTGFTGVPLSHVPLSQPSLSRPGLTHIPAAPRPVVAPHPAGGIHVIHR